MQQIDKSIFQFPKSLPNDLEGFCNFYPRKFPKIIPLFEKLAKKYFNKPKEFKKFIYQQQKELFAGFEKIKKDYEKEKRKTEELIVKTDQRLHKLFCFRFWIVNYGFCDGPLHDYYVEKIRYYAELAADWETIEEKQPAILDFERTLLQGDYADLYLQGAFLGIKIFDFFNSSKVFKNQVREIIKKINEKKARECYPIIDNILDYMNNHKDNAEVKKAYQLLRFPIENAKIRGDNLSIYNNIIHAFEFHEKNLELKRRHDLIKGKIKQIFNSASKRLTKSQLSDLKVCYQMSNLFKEAKDVYGAIDDQLLPFWFDMLYLLAEKYNIKKPESGPFIGHSAMFYLLVWYLPPKLKAEVFTPDPTGFSLKTL